MEIKKGNSYMCIKTVLLDSSIESRNGKPCFIKGNIYESDEDNFLIDEMNDVHCVSDKKWTLKRFIMNENKDTHTNTPINPKHYSFNIKGTPCDLFDIGNAMDLNKEQFTALRYFRKKENQIEDTKKAIKCLERLVERLEAEKND